MAAPPPTVPIAHAAAAVTSSRSSSSTEPLVVGRYAVFDRIAAGGMAAVHVARLAGQGGFARTVAAKRLHPQFALDPDFVAMFLDEARLAARIRHPNVVQTLDIVAAEGELFLVMEYVDGEPLSALLRAANERGVPVPVAIAAGVLAQALHGLHAAHEAKNDHGEPLHLVHRDVSPQNILVASDGVARVLDFGVAKALGKSHTTREGQLKGKLGYLAPEQVLGHSVTRRSDVFAAAIVLWEALAGARLFTAESEGAVLRQIMDSEVAPPGSRRSGVPAELDAVVMRALSKEPAFRYDTALAMGDAIEAATTVATTREIGEWVRDLARERLAARAQIVGAIESGTAGGIAAPPPPVDARPSPQPSSSDKGGDKGSDKSRDEGASTHVSIVTDSLSPRASKRAPWAAFALGAAALAIATVAIVGRGHGHAGPSERSPAAETSGIPSFVTAPEAPPSPPAPSATPSAAAPSPSAGTSGASASAAPSAASPPRSRTPRPRPATPPKPVGSSIYTRD